MERKIGWWRCVFFSHNYSKIILLCFKELFSTSFEQAYVWLCVLCQLSLSFFSRTHNKLTLDVPGKKEIKNVFGVNLRNTVCKLKNLKEKTKT